MYMTAIERAEYKPPRIRQQGMLISADPFEARVLDVLGAGILLIFLGPLMLLIALSIFIANPGPVLFRQNRLGRDGRLFKCLKFRTMATDAEARLSAVLANDKNAQDEWDRDHKLRDDPRVVGIGNFLRKSSLDELPQLFNILKGDMSLVGPRPIVPAEVKKYGRYFDYYCRVRPGLTGLWQISGRNDVNYRRRIAFDVVYVKQGDVGQNLKILLLTVPSVLRGRGSY